MGNIDVLGTKRKRSCPCGENALNSAAREALKEAVELTIKTKPKGVNTLAGLQKFKLEFCGLLCCKPGKKPGTGEVIYTQPVPGFLEITWVNKNGVRKAEAVRQVCDPVKKGSRCPSGSRVAGWYHTHPEEEGGLSDRDVSVAHQKGGYPIFLQEAGAEPVWRGDPHHKLPVSFGKRGWGIMETTEISRVGAGGTQEHMGWKPFVPVDENQ